MNERKRMYYDHLSVLARCYETGDFEELFSRLDKGCVWESMRVLTPRVGYDVLCEYYREKGRLMREGDCCPTATIVELVGNLNMGKPVQDGSDRPKPRVGLLYDHGELCLYMMQIVDGEKLDSILKLTLADDGKIARIDMCDTGFFSFRKFEESEG